MVIMGSGLQALFTVTVTLFICQENQYLATFQHLQTTKCMVHHGILSIISNEKVPQLGTLKLILAYILILLRYLYYILITIQSEQQLDLKS